VFTSLWQWLYDVPLIGAVRDSPFAFPILECFHLYSMVFLLAMVVMFDLRLMGVPWANQGPSSLARFARQVLTWIWLPLLVNGLTGTLLFGTMAPDYSHNWAFQTKIALLFGGVAYHLAMLVAVARWREDATTGAVTKLMSALAVLVWPSVIIASRWIAYA
jgi:hypothetical protein